MCWLCWRCVLVLPVLVMMVVVVVVVVGGGGAYEVERSRVRTIQSAIHAALSTGGVIEKNIKKSAYAIPFYKRGRERDARAERECDGSLDFAGKRRAKVAT